MAIGPLAQADREPRHGILAQILGARIGLGSLAALLLHERATLITWAGSLLVVSGLIIVVLSQGKTAG